MRVPNVPNVSPKCPRHKSNIRVGLARNGDILGT